MFQNLMRAFISYLRTSPVIHAAEAKSDLREELEFHLVSSAQDQLGDQLTEGGQEDDQRAVEAAQQEALNRFGDVSSVVRECCQVSISQEVFWHRVHQGVTVALICAVGFLIYHTQLSQQSDPHADFAGEASKQTEHLSQQEMAIAISGGTASGYSPQETDGSIFGSVVGENGQPVNAAHVLAVVKTWPPHGFRQQAYMATSQSDGSFEFKNVYPTGHEYEIQIAALAGGRLLQSQYISMTTGVLDPFEFRLKSSMPLALRFESENGEPIEGVRVFPFERVDDLGQRHIVYFDSADPIVRESNEAGNVPMPHFLPGEQATLYVQFPNGDWQTRQLVIPAGSDHVVLRPTADPAIESG